jgi:hypothetical protein
MSKQNVPFAAADISALARSLRGQLATLDHPPSHLEMLNLLARAAGFANFQALRADADAQGRLSTQPPPDAADHARVEKVLRHFDKDGLMLRWPGKTSHQELCIWVIWSRLPAGERLSESEINAFIKDGHAFGDHALLRRTLVDMGMLARTPDGRIYRRIEKQPGPDVLALLKALALRTEA